MTNSHSDPLNCLALLPPVALARTSGHHPLYKHASLLSIVPGMLVHFPTDTCLKLHCSFKSHMVSMYNSKSWQPVVFTGTRIHKLKVIQCISCCTGTKQLAIAFLFNYWLCLVVQLHLVYGNALDQYPVFDLDYFVVYQNKYLHPSYNLECKTTTCRVAITIYWIPSYNWMKKMIKVACIKTIQAIQCMPFSLRTQNWLWKHSSC